MVKIVTSTEFDNEIREGITFVDFFATWCGPCKMIAPIVDSVSEELTNIKFIKVDVDDSSDIAQNFGIMSIPTLVIFKDGEVVARHTGLLSKTDLIEFINNNK